MVDRARKQRSYSSTINGAVIMTGLLPMPNAHETTAAAYHPQRQVARLPRKTQYRVRR